MFALVHVDILNKEDTVVQIATCTFDAHIQEILGSLMCSATLILLHPEGNMDFSYVTRTLQVKQVTCMDSVPSFLNHILDILKSSDLCSWLTIRTLCCVGT